MPSLSYMALTCMPQSHCHAMTANITVVLFSDTVRCHRANVKRRFGLCRVGDMPMLKRHAGSSGLIRKVVCGNKLKPEEDRLRAIQESDDATGLSLELVNLDHNADTFGHRGCFRHQIA